MSNTTSKKTSNKNKNNKNANVIALRNWPSSNVVSIKDFQRQKALQNLRQLTGLKLHAMPEPAFTPE